MNSFLAAFACLILPVAALGQGICSERLPGDAVLEKSDRPYGERAFRTGGDCGGGVRLVPVQEGMPEGLPEGMPWEQKSTDEGGSGGEKAPAEDGGEGTPAPQEEAP